VWLLLYYCSFPGTSDGLPLLGAENPYHPLQQYNIENSQEPFAKKPKLDKRGFQGHIQIRILKNDMKDKIISMGTLYSLNNS